MTPEEDRLRLNAIKERIELVRSWVAGMDEAQFLAHQMARDAAALSLLIIGETARRLEEETKSRAPEVPRPAIIALRNRIAHGYETVDHQLVWQIISQDLPPLANAVDRLLADAERD